MAGGNRGDGGATGVPAGGVRLDVFLWAVRAYKTRPVAAAACRGGHVRCRDGRRPAKASSTVRPGDRVTFSKDGLTRTLEVLKLTSHRLPARSVPEFVRDLTPDGEIERARAARAQARENDVFAGAELAGSSRPTKRDRRLWEKFIKSAKP